MRRAPPGPWLTHHQHPARTSLPVANHPGHHRLSWGDSMSRSGESHASAVNLPPAPARDPVTAAAEALTRSDGELLALDQLPANHQHGHDPTPRAEAQVPGGHPWT